MNGVKIALPDKYKRPERSGLSGRVVILFDKFFSKRHSLLYS